MLIENMMSECVLIDETTASDGAGGVTTTYTEGASFMAAITMDTTVEAQLAQAQGVTSVYTVTTNQNAAPAYDKKFKRISDGRYFRVTSLPEDKKTPSVSTLNLAQVKAERWTP